MAQQPWHATVDRRGFLVRAGAALPTLLHPATRHLSLGRSARPGPPVTSPKRQLRGVWVTSLRDIDWPNTPGLSAARLQADYTDLLDALQRIGVNAVFVQVRPTADAFWPSPFEPWSEWLTGVQGRDPGWDPLDFAVRAAHLRGIAFHAWVNPFRISLYADPTRLHPDHPALRHPEWVVRHSGELYYDPGHRVAREFVEQAIAATVARYPVDGVHFDDYLYPYPGTERDFADGDSYRRYGQGISDRRAWRRQNADLFVRGMRDLLRAIRPDAAFGVGPFGIWRNARTDPLGSATNGLQSYDQLYADTRRWVREEWVDYLAPQLYWQIGHPLADYAVLAPWWARQAAGTTTQLWIGHPATRPGAPDQPGWRDPGELSRHLAMNATLPNMTGDLLYNATAVRADRIGAISRMAADHWALPALRPLLPRHAAQPPPAPPRVRRTRDGAGRPALAVEAGATGEPFQYALYPPVADPATDPPLALFPGHVRELTLPPAATGPAVYAVTAVDRANRESRPVVG
ncbi:glycoside hydrolase family 10 protein [Kitasatospora sp. LaBMicrA B282]|uniref:glycoside hydrolase family 10 protein n=1 Tax=Kitasatospora sp. LaBMicrA B282 TaxID=3420949 RepID=UPI003D0F040F